MVPASLGAPSPRVPATAFAAALFGGPWLVAHPVVTGLWLFLRRRPLWRSLACGSSAPSAKPVEVTGLWLIRVVRHLGHPSSHLGPRLALTCPPPPCPPPLPPPWPPPWPPPLAVAGCCLGRCLAPFPCLRHAPSTLPQSRPARVPCAALAPTYSHSFPAANTPSTVPHSSSLPPSFSFPPSFFLPPCLPPCLLLAPSLPPALQSHTRGARRRGRTRAR